MRKRLTIFAVALITLMGLVSCNVFDNSSDSDDDPPIYELPESSDYSYCVQVYPVHQTLFVYHNAGATIDSIYVTVNGTELDMYVSNNAHGEYPFVEGETYAIDVTVNGTYHQAVDLTIATTPEVDFPIYYEEGLDVLITWSLSRNAKTQYLYFARGRDDTYYPYHCPVYLYPEQRRYTVDADLFNLNNNSYLAIKLLEFNWIAQSEFLFYSCTYVYNDGWRAEDVEKHLGSENH